jgi:hypothetical protein
VAYGSFVPQADVSANKMLRSSRMAAMTGRAAAFEVVANVGSGPFVSLEISGVSGSAKLPQKRSFLAGL